MESEAWSTLWASFILYVLGSLIVIVSLRRLRGMLLDGYAELTLLRGEALLAIIIGGVMIKAVVRKLIWGPSNETLSLVASMLAPLYAVLFFSGSLRVLSSLAREAVAGEERDAHGPVIVAALSALLGLELLSLSLIPAARAIYDGLAFLILGLAATVAILVLAVFGARAIVGPGWGRRLTRPDGI